MSAVDHIESPDGTRIAYRRVGRGDPVVAIHGGLGTWRSWLPVAERLADEFEFFLIERRGRGDSGDATNHSLAVEVDDALAVLAQAGPSAALVGHSFGGTVALEAAAASGAARVAVYEPAVGIGGLIPAAAISKIDELVNEGDHAAALDLGLAQLEGAELVATAKVPDGARRPQALLDLTPTIARELRAVDGLGADVERYAQLDACVQVLIGTASLPRAREAAERLGASMPRAEIAWLSGYGHVAHTAAPDVVAAALGPFLRGGRG
jgi:pimeloyl-ACP methyl ester carboxylesterase